MKKILVPMVLVAALALAGCGTTTMTTTQTMTTGADTIDDAGMTESTTTTITNESGY